MGLFEFVCPNGHVTEDLYSLKTRPDAIKCACGEEAKLTISAVKTNFHANDRKAIKGATISRRGTRT